MKIATSSIVRGFYHARVKGLACEMSSAMLSVFTKINHILLTLELFVKVLQTLQERASVLSGLIRASLYYFCK